MPFDPPPLFDIDARIRDRVRELNDEAGQFRTRRLEQPAQPGPVARMRATVGRELIAIGCAVAGPKVCVSLGGGVAVALTPAGRPSRR